MSDRLEKMIVTEKQTGATHWETMVGMSRPEANDRAMPMAYGDCVLLSSVLGSGSLAYLCEEGCVVMDPDVETRTSSRELVFQVGPSLAAVHSLPVWGGRGIQPCMPKA